MFIKKNNGFVFVGIHFETVLFFISVNYYILIKKKNNLLFLLESRSIYRHELLFI